MRKHLLITIFSLQLLNAIQAAPVDAQLEQTFSELKLLQPPHPRKILIFSVTNGYKHKSIAIGNNTLSAMGKKTGAYEALVSNDLSNFEPENISQFDAICFLNTTLEVFSPHKKELKKMSAEEKAAWLIKETRLKASLMDFIKSGKGFIGIHSATDTFYKWPEYGDMIGAYFDGHPWGSKDLINIQVEEGQENHCCMAHMDSGSMSFKEEIYQFKAPYDANKLEVLLRLDPEKNDLSKGKREDNDYPVSWVKSYGAGRVFYSSLGHNNHIYSNPEVLQHFLNGIQWSIGEVATNQ